MFLKETRVNFPAKVIGAKWYYKLVWVKRLVVISLLRWWKHMNLKTVVFSLVQRAYVLNCSEQSLSKILAMPMFIGKQKSCASCIVRLHFYSTGLHDTHTYTYNDSTYSITEWAKRSATEMLIFRLLPYHDAHVSGDFLAGKPWACVRGNRCQIRTFLWYCSSPKPSVSTIVPFSLKAKRCSEVSVL